MKLKKLISLLILTAVICVPILACGDTGDTENITDTTAEGETQGGDEFIDDTDRAASDIEPRPDYAELPVRDLGGYTFRIISRSEQANSHWWNLDMWAEEETGDPINDAVYARNNAIEERYNIEITNFHADDVAGRARTSVRAGSDDYDLIVIGLTGGQETLTQDGMLHDLKQAPHIDLSKRWWDQRAVEQLSITNRLFATSSDLTIRDKDAIIILMFSKTLAQNYDLGDLYSFVTNGSWTFEKMLEMIKLAASDLNGDGIIDHEDQIGLLTQRAHAAMLFNAAGESTARLNDEGIPEITMYNSRAIEVTEVIREMHLRPHAINADEMGSLFADVWDGFQVPMFAEDRALFYHAGMNRVTLLRTMETDFGILPPPKFDANQANYHVAVDPWCTSAVSIPITVPNLETTGLILEALTYESRYTLLPAYYDINLKTKFARDDESKEMIDIILENRFYDIGRVYGWGNMAGFLHDDIAAGRAGTLTTFFERNEARIQTAIDRTIDRLEEID